MERWLVGFGKWLVHETNKKIMKNITQLLDLISGERDYLLNHVCKTTPKNQIHLPSSSHFDECFLPSNRNGQTLRSLAQLYQHGN